MANAFKLPDLGEGLTEGEVARWLVTEGQTVDEDEPLVEIQTDKATVEIPSPYSGTVLKIYVPEGEVAPVGTVLVVIGEPGETFDASPAPAPARATVSCRAAQRRLACPGRTVFRRRRWCEGSPRSSASTWGRSRPRVPAGASARTTCVQQLVARTRAKGDASHCVASGGSSPST